MKNKRGFITIVFAGWMAIATVGGIAAIDHANTKDKPVAFGPYHSVAESVADYYRSRDAAQAKK